MVCISACSFEKKKVLVLVEISCNLPGGMQNQYKKLGKIMDVLNRVVPTL